MKFLPVLLPLLLVQDAGRAWNRPVELIRSSDSMTSAGLTFDGTSIQAWAFEGAGEKSWTLRSYTSADDGRTWKKDTGFDFGELSVLAYLIREGRVEALAQDEEGNPSFISGDLKTGKELVKVKFAPKGVESPGDLFQVEILAHGGELFLLCTNEIESDLAEVQLRVYNSKDGGKAWTLSTPEKWLHHTPTPCNPLLFEAGGAIHVIYSREDDGSEIAHFSSADKGATWKKEPKIIFKDVLARPLSIGVNGAKLALIVSVQAGEDEQDGSLQAYLSADGGQTWTAGGKLYDTVLDAVWAAVRVEVSGDSLLFLGQKGGVTKSTGITCLSRDGGKTWKDLEFTQGLARTSQQPEGAFSKDGKTIHVVFLNEEDHDEDDKAAHSHVILWRRWGDAVPFVPLTDAEQKQIREWLGLLDVISASKVVEFGERAEPLIDKAISEAGDAKVKERLASLRKVIHPDWMK